MFKAGNLYVENVISIHLPAPGLHRLVLLGFAVCDCNLPRSFTSMLQLAVAHALGSESTLDGLLALELRLQRVWYDSRWQVAALLSTAPSLHHTLLC